MKTSTQLLLLPALLLTFTAACGGGDDDNTGDDDTVTPDAAGTARVTEVDCAGATLAATVTTSGFAYSPDAVTISAGEVVKFAPTTGHDVASNDNLFSVPLAGEGCFRFDEAGSYTFHCTPHGFQGTITVQ